MTTLEELAERIRLLESVYRAAVAYCNGSGTYEQLTDAVDAIK
jgi:hypothetical protein